MYLIDNVTVLYAYYKYQIVDKNHALNVYPSELHITNFAEVISK